MKMTETERLHFSSGLPEHFPASSEEWMNYIKNRRIETALGTEYGSWMSHKAAAFFWKSKYRNIHSAEGKPSSLTQQPCSEFYMETIILRLWNDHQIQRKQVYFLLYLSKLLFAMWGLKQGEQQQDPIENMVRKKGVKDITASKYYLICRFKKKKKWLYFLGKA